MGTETWTEGECIDSFLFLSSVDGNRQLYDRENLRVVYADATRSHVCHVAAMT